MMENRPVQGSSATPGRGSTIADHFMRRIAVDDRETPGQNDMEWALNQLGSMRPFPPDY
jgi:hypothetical protein